jgi:hypothetical protein
VVRPYAVDVSSGIEALPGIKDGERMRQFLREVRRVDSEQQIEANGAAMDYSRLSRRAAATFGPTAAPSSRKR